MNTGGSAAARSRASAILLAMALCACVLVATARAHPVWRSAHVVGYSTKENLVGCRGYFASGERACGTACGHPWGYLHDWQYTVASNPRLHLSCGEKIRLCGAARCHDATVTDRTASVYDFEMTFTLSCATGGRCSYRGFADPRYVKWRRLG